MITFIVTTYNLEDWLLRRCLRSIVAQGLSRADYEIIVVDDESCIPPRAVVDEFASEVDITLHIQPHARQGAARNLALRHARGEWVQFVDGDDYLFAGFMPTLLSMAERNRLDLLMYSFLEVTGRDVQQPECSSVIEPIRGEGRGEHLLPAITTGDDYMSRHNLFGSCWTLLFRRALLDDAALGAPLRFTEGIYIEDEEFVTHLVWRAQRIARVDVPVYAYYQRSGSTVHNPDRHHTDELFRSYLVVIQRLQRYARSLGSIPHEGLTRKIRFLAVDVMRRALREPDWSERCHQVSSQLLGLDLYPLPAASYSWRYRLFRRLMLREVGLYILKIAEKLRR